MSDTRDVATLLLLQSVVAKKLAEQSRATRDQAGDAFNVIGMRDVGMIGDEPIGTVQLNKGRETWAVTDEKALLAWVEASFPEQVETVRRVRPAYVAALLARAKAEGVPITDAGELIPGIQVHESDPTLMVKASEDAPDVIARAFAEGRLNLGDLSAPVAIEAS